MARISFGPIDGKTITTTPVSAVTFGGSEVSLGNDDTGLSGNSAAANQLLNAQIFDNLVITPEPASLGLLAVAGNPAPSPPSQGLSDWIRFWKS